MVNGLMFQIVVNGFDFKLIPKANMLWQLSGYNMCIRPESQMPQLVMRNNNLTNLPELDLPSEISICSYKDGFEKGWSEIIAKSFGDNQYINAFNRLMKSDIYFKPERVLFLKDSNRLIATASAWFKPKYGAETGCLHYVGVLPDYQGKHLGYQITLAAMRNLVEDGFKAVTLETDDYRISALKIYLRLGFEPFLVHENQRDRWMLIFNQIDNSGHMLNKYEKTLNEAINVLPG